MYVYIAGRFDADVELDIAGDSTAANGMYIGCVDTNGYTPLSFYNGVQTGEHHREPDEEQNGSVESRWECAMNQMGCCPLSMSDVTTISCDDEQPCEVLFPFNTAHPNVPRSVVIIIDSVYSIDLIKLIC